MVRRSSAAVALVALGLALVFGACAEASGELRGHDQEIDTTPPRYVGCDTTEGIDAGTGARWGDLYRDLFGPTSAAKCADPSCHGSESGGGFRTSSFGCFDEKQCRQGVFDYGLVDLDRDPAAPERSAFVAILRRCDQDRKTVGIMPKDPRSYYFSRASIARVEEWIRTGAPDN